MWPLNDSGEGEKGETGMERTSWFTRRICSFIRIARDSLERVGNYILSDGKEKRGST